MAKGHARVRYARENRGDVGTVAQSGRARRRISESGVTEGVEGLLLGSGQGRYRRMQPEGLVPV